MKNLLLSTLVIASAMSFTSCKKSYTCDCVATQEIIISEEGYPDEIMAGSTANYSYAGDMKKKDSEDWCSANEGTSSTDMMGMVTTTTITCTLN